MKVFNLVFIIIFIIFAALQYNDPDPYIWMPIYLYGAWLCYQAYHKKYDSRFYIAGFVIYLGYAAFLLVDKTGVIDWATQHGSPNIAEKMKADKPWIEETREFFGLLIIVVVMLTNTMWLKKSRQKRLDAKH